jgi:hypothetical protein
MAIGKKTGGGSRKGKPNRATATVREAFEHAFQMLQEDDRANLATWGRANPTEFYRLAAKLIPTNLNISGDITITFVDEFA